MKYDYRISYCWWPEYPSWGIYRCIGQINICLGKFSVHLVRCAKG